MPISTWSTGLTFVLLAQARPTTPWSGSWRPSLASTVDHSSSWLSRSAVEQLSNWWNNDHVEDEILGQNISWRRWKKSALNYPTFSMWTVWTAKAFIISSFRYCCRVVKSSLTLCFLNTSVHFYIDLFQVHKKCDQRGVPCDLVTGEERKMVRSNFSYSMPSVANTSIYRDPTLKN